jgi:hypothetical protein
MELIAKQAQRSVLIITADTLYIVSSSNRVGMAKEKWSRLFTNVTKDLK